MVPLPPLVLANRCRDELEWALVRVTRGLPELLPPAADEVWRRPRDELWARRRARLYRYRPTQPTSRPRPVLLIYSLLNRSYILDLRPGVSFVEYLVDQGLDVYLLDWGVPAPEDKDLRLDDYILDLLPAAVRVMGQTAGTREFSLLGYCMGGNLALLYAATHPRAPLRNLACLATPIDLHQLGLFDVLLDERSCDVDQLVDMLGNVPGEWLQQGFHLVRLLQPCSDLARQRALW